MLGVGEEFKAEAEAEVETGGVHCSFGAGWVK